MEAVRRYLASQPTAISSWTAGMRDPIVGRALGLLQSQIARRWTTEDLAREIAVSRSAFAERFTRVIGEPPMRYLARLRFEQASARLRDSADPISRIAFEVGYESEAAFNRAFRREYGVPPASWRRDHMSGKA
jgi:AraC-like DNA-binding protein